MRIAGLVVALLFAGCSTPPPPEPAAPAAGCSPATYFLTASSWSRSPPSGEAASLDFLPGAGAVEFSITLPLEPPVAEGFVFYNGSFSFRSSGYAVESPTYPWDIVVREPLIGLDGPQQLGPGMAFTLPFTNHVAAGWGDPSGQMESLSVSSLYLDANPQGGLALRTHTVEAPTSIVFTHCPP